MAADVPIERGAGMTATAGGPAGGDGLHREGLYRDGLYRDGIVSLEGAFSRQWADDLRSDFEALYVEAERRDQATVAGGATGRVPRGPGADAKRWYLAVHPQRLRGFRELVTHPLIDAVCREVLGDAYQFVEIGFDVALPGAVKQPLHRDFPTPDETRASGRFSSLAVNATCVDVTPEMGPLEIALGTHIDDGSDFEQGMRVPVTSYDRYVARLQRRMPVRGDVSIRSGLTVHRGTDNRSSSPRPVLVLGVMGAEYETFAEHHLAMTTDYYERLPGEVRSHLDRCTVTDDLQPIVQDYVLDFLLQEG